MDPHEKAAEVGASNATTELPDTLRRAKHHKNKVSWGPTSPVHEPTARTSPVPPMSQAAQDEMDLNSHISDPSLQAAMRGQPLMNSTRETLAGMNELSNEANMLIQETLDEIDPTSVGASSASKHTFMQLPESVTSDVFEQPKSLPPPMRNHRSTPSTAEDLFRLTADLADLNQQLNQEDTNAKSPDNAPATLRDSNRRAEMLVQMGTSKANLMRRSMVFGRSRRNLLAGVEEDFHPSATIEETAGSTSDENPEDGGNAKKNDDMRGDAMHDIEEGKTSDTNKTRNSQRLRTAKAAKTTKVRIQSQYREFEDWLNMKRPGVIRYMRTVLFFLIIPATAAAAILFYLVDNPPCGTAEECELANRITTEPIVVVQDGITSVTQVPVAIAAAVVNGTNATLSKAPTAAPKENVEEFVTNAVSFFQSASASWWILFICVRLVVTLSLSFMTETFLIDFLTLRSKWAVTIFGPFVTLFLVQSHGWPLIAMFWGGYNFALLYGPNRFAEHWGYWQTWVGLFNEENPSGNVTSSDEYRTLLIILVVLGLVTALKRFWVTLFLGKQTYTRYAEELAKVMKKALIVGQVSGLARDKAELGLDYDDLSIHLDINQARSEEAEENSLGERSDNMNTTDDDGGDTTRDGDTTSPHLNAFKAARAVSIHRQLISDLLGDWEEPGVANKNETDSPPISALIQFRQSIMSSLHTNYPFSYAFGPAANRYECVESSQVLFDKLVGDAPTLKFDLLALLAVDKHGHLDQQFVKDMIKLFRPDREGRISKIDFVRSIDNVYKEMRLLRANITNGSKMDRSFETIINVGFYFLVVLCVAAALGINPMVLLGSVSAFVVGLAFMIGSAASSYFEGILYVLARRPYDIGDAIAVSNPTVDTPLGGNVPWFVTDVNLYTTTAQYGPTNEIATIANGCLARTRVINFNRAKRANVLIFLKFSVDAPYPKLRIFRAAVEKYVKNRPREWTALLAFRADWMFGEQGAVQWLLLLQHRRPWQEIGDVLDSRGEMMCFSCELAKKLDIIYHQPAMPIEFSQGSVRPAATNEITMPVLGENGSSPSAAMSPTPLSGPPRSAHAPRYNSDDLQDVTSMFKKRFDVPI